MNIKKLLRQNLDITTIKFLLIGVVNTFFGTAIMFLAYNVVHLSYWVSSALNYILGSILSFFLNKKITFKSKKKSFDEAIKFIINISLCYVIAYGVAKPFVRMILINSSEILQENGAMIVGMGLFVILNYFGQRYFVFKQKKGD